MGDSQHAFPKAVSDCLSHSPSIALFQSPLSLFYLLLVGIFWFNRDFQLSLSSITFDMKPMNRTLLLSLLYRCQQILEDTSIDISGLQINRTVSSTTVSPLSSTSPVTTVSSSRKNYDNAYFYILFVMLFYSFLAMTLFKCFIGSDEEKKDPYEEFINTGQPSTQKFNTGHMAEKFYFEEESSLWAKVFLRRRREGMNTWGDVLTVTKPEKRRCGVLRQDLLVILQNV